jgi:hypothetical protein
MAELPPPFPGDAAIAVTALPITEIHAEATTTASPRHPCSIGRPFLG